MFENCVGQDSVKKTLAFHIEGYHATKVLPPLMFIAERGIGKTMFCRALGKELGKEMLELSGASIKSDKQFVHQIIYELKDKPVTLFVDEIHAIPWTVTTLLLTMLNETEENKGVIVFEDETIQIDFTKFSLLGATTQRHRVFTDLLDRFTHISFNEYKMEEIAMILSRYSRVRISDELLLEAATYCRGNGRNARELGKTIRTYCAVNHLTEFTAGHFPVLLDKISLFPLGLNQQEVNVLRKIAESKGGGITLTALSSKTGLDPAAQQSTEKYLLKHGIMEIEGKRRITAKGRKYLEELEAWQKSVDLRVAAIAAK